MRAWLTRAWAFLRELSGEAALERRMQASCGCGAKGLAPRAAVKEAWTEAYGGIHRCC